MSDSTIKVTGWLALVVIVGVIGFVGLRLLMFNDKTDDTALMGALEVQLMSDYYPDLTERLQAAYETGDRDEVERVAQSVTTTRVQFDSVQTSSALFEFSTPKDVVVKVRYSLYDDSGAWDERTRYYLFRYGALGNNWQYQYETGAVRYYLNFF